MDVIHGNYINNVTKKLIKMCQMNTSFVGKKLYNVRQTYIRNLKIALINNKKWFITIFNYVLRESI